MLTLKDITLVKKNITILDHLNLEIHNGEIHSLLGVNGTGKSTLAYVIMGLPEYQPQGGQIWWNHRNITRAGITERAKLGITLTWQEPARFEGLTVVEYLRIGQRGRENPPKIADCLEMVGLDPRQYLRRTVDETLSGGERKRIELAAVLAMQPRLAILDEPDSGIDALSIENIIAVIRTLQKQGATVLLITHHENVAAMGDRASTICGGKILKTGTPDEITLFFREHCKECSHVNRPTTTEFAGI